MPIGRPSVVHTSENKRRRRVRASRVISELNSAAERLSRVGVVVGLAVLAISALLLLARPAVARIDVPGAVAGLPTYASPS